MQLHGILILVVVLSVQGSLADTSCQGNKNETFWKERPAKSCLQWPYVRKFIPVIPSADVRRNIGGLYKMYWVFTNEGPEQALETFFDSFDELVKNGNHWKVPRTLFQIAKKLVKEIRPSMAETLYRFEVVFAKWLKKTMLQPAYAPESYDGPWGGYGGYACYAKGERERRKRQEKDWQDRLMERYMKQFERWQNIIVSKVFTMVEELNQCVVEDDNRTGNTENGLWQCIDKTFAGNFDVPKALEYWRLEVPTMHGGYFTYLANTSLPSVYFVTLDKVVSDSLACVLQKDKDKVAEHLYHGVGSNQPFTRLFNFLGQFRFKPNMTAVTLFNRAKNLELEAKNNGTSDDDDYPDFALLEEDEVSYYYYQDYSNRTSQVFLERVVGQYPTEVKAGIRFLAAIFPRSKQKSFSAATMDLAKQVHNLLNEFPIQYYSSKLLYGSGDCTYLGQFLIGLLPGLELYVETELNNVIYADKAERIKEHTQWLKSATSFAKQKLTDLLELDKKPYLDALISFVQNPKLNLDTYINKEWIDEKVDVLIKNLFPVDLTKDGSVKILDEVEFLGKTYEFDYRQAYRLITLTHIHKSF